MSDLIPLWMARKESGELIGPISKSEMIQLLQSGDLTQNDSCCSGNGYWIFIREKDLLEKFIYSDEIQGFEYDSEVIQEKFEYTLALKLSEIDSGDNSKPVTTEASLTDLKDDEEDQNKNKIEMELDLPSIEYTKKNGNQCDLGKSQTKSSGFKAPLKWKNNESNNELSDELPDESGLINLKDRKNKVKKIVVLIILCFGIFFGILFLLNKFSIPIFAQDSNFDISKKKIFSV